MSRNVGNRFSLLGEITTETVTRPAGDRFCQSSVACCLLYCFNLDFFVFIVAGGAFEQQVVRLDDAARS